MFKAFSNISRTSLYRGECGLGRSGGSGIGGGGQQAPWRVTEALDGSEMLSLQRQEEGVSPHLLCNFQ